ncbi:MAG TPA: MraY family glycosyltransferase [Bacillota bacterium]|nr:MraY family glycosyltransferase [Bacillota bacterium]
MEYLLPFIVSAVLSALLAPPMLSLAQRYKFLDKANERKVHTGTKPYLGGAAIFAAFSVTSMLFLREDPRLPYLLGGGGFYFVLGLVDDRVDLPARVKLIAELAVTFFIVWLGMRQGLLLENPFGRIGFQPFFMWLSIPFSVLWIVGIANAVNLIDGLDAMASGVVLIACIALSVAALINPVISFSPFLMVLAGSIAGYIRYNLYPARIIMGDSGALFLGYAIAFISLSSFVNPNRSIFLSLIPPAMALFVPIFDTLAAICRRSINGRHIFAPDKNHLHHCLLERGYSHPKAVRIVWAASAGFGGVSLLLSELIYKQIYLALALLALVVAWAVYYALANGFLVKLPGPKTMAQTAVAEDKLKKAQ